MWKIALTLCLVLAATLALLLFLQKPALVPAPVPTAKDEVAEALGRLSVEQKLGQLFFLGIAESVALDAFLPLVRTGRVSGIILMGGNVRVTENVAVANEELQRTAASTSPDTAPLFIATDQEGGAVSRFKGSGYIQTAQSKIHDPSEAHDVGLKRGRELRALGVNVNFAPVLDDADASSFLYDRTFRGTQDDIAELGIAMSRGLHEAQVIAVPKHFPGHPKSSTDSHKVLPKAEGDLAWFRTHISQFSRLFKENPPVMLMTAHVQYPSIDSVPATLSRTILTDMLRKEFAFDGVLVTDDLNMGALRSSFSLAEAAVRALEAGNDMLLIVGTAKDLDEAQEAVRAALKSGRVSESRIEESVRRILALKQSLAGHE